MIGAITAGLYGTGVPPVTNSYESIATVLVGSGGSSTITFSSIPSTFKHLQIRAISRAVNNVGGDDPLLRLNSDSGNNYSWHRLTGNGAAASAVAGASQPQVRYAYNTADASYGSNIFTGFVLDLLDYQNTSKNKTLRVLSGADNNGSGYINLTSGAWYNTAAVNRIDLLPYSGNFAQFSQFALYGIKG